METEKEFNKLISDLNIQNYEWSVSPSEIFNNFMITLSHVNADDSSDKITRYVALPISDHLSLFKISKYLMVMRTEIEKKLSPARKIRHMIHLTEIDKANLLSEEIIKFLEQYAVKPDHLEGAYNGPDPSCLEYAAEQLRKDGFVNSVPFSEWSSGCYKPYTSKEGREQHESILNQIKKFVKK